MTSIANTQIPDMDQLIPLVLSVKSIVDDESNISQQIKKGAFDFATQVDIKVQEYLKKELLERYPLIQFMGEEGEEEALDFSRPMWILDPIDGTTNLMHRYPLCAVSLGLLIDGSMELGIIYNPFTGDLFTGQKGKGAFHNGRSIHVSPISSMEESLISIGTSPYHKELAAPTFEAVQNIFTECMDIRRGGAASLDLAYVACGITEGYFEMTLKPWDYAAGYCILTEAGGKLTTVDNQPLILGNTSSVLASNGSVHERLVVHLKPLA